MDRKQEYENKHVKFLLLNLQFMFKLPAKHVTEGQIEERIEVTGRRGRRRKQLLDDLKEKREDTGN
jgi:hypothetical protein